MVRTPFRIDFDTSRYWEGCRSRKLLIARCRDCRTWIHPPRAACPACWSESLDHDEVSGAARVYSFTRTTRGDDGVAHVTVWAELAEQERLIVIGDLEPDGGDLEIGQDLELVWRDLGDRTVPAFRKARDR